jgi:hypothetical protein
VRSGRGRGTGLANWVVDRTSGFLDARLSRRSFIARATLLGTAVAASGCAVVTRPGSPYSRITDCGPNDLCRDGYTDFCCTINDGVNACPPNTAPAGWWRADFSVYCNGTRYYIDCNEVCCGPLRGDGFCAGCAECRCARGCDTRKVHCNYFRYGQCNQVMANVGPIACRMVTCVPPYQLDLGCSPSGAVDNSTANHFTDCSRFVPPAPPSPPASTSVGSAVARTTAEILVAVRGPDRQAYARRFVAGQWPDWVHLGGQNSSRVAAVARPPGRVDVFARGTDLGLWQRWTEDGSNWSSWVKLGDSIGSDPAPIAAPHGLFVFARGVDGGVHTLVGDGDTWQGWTKLGDGIGGNPIPVLLGAQLFLFVRGTDNGTHVRRFDGTRWQEWTPLGATTDADPGAVAYGSSLLVFAKSGDALWSRTLTGSTWGPWNEVAPGNIGSRPEPVVFGNRVFVFVRGLDEHTHYRVWNGTAWSDWTSLGGNSTVTPAPVAVGPNLYVFVRGTDDALYHRGFDGSTWSDWIGLGGSVDAVSGAG